MSMGCSAIIPAHVHSSIASSGRCSWRTSFTVAALLSLVVAGVGIGPHVWFSIHLGEVTQFKAAYDEDTYARLAVVGLGRTGRLLASALFKDVYGVAGRNLGVTLAIADAIFPAVAALSACALAAVVTRSTPSRLLVALLLLFGQELFSFGSSTVTWLLPDGWSLARARAAFAASRPDLIPDYFTSYFSLFRTPEPQVSLPLVFLHLAGVIALVSGRGRRYDAWLLAGLTASHALLIYEYAFLLALVVTLEGLLVLMLVGARQWTEAGRLVLTMVPLGALAMFHGWAPTPSRFLFHSSAPILTPAVVYSVLLLLLTVTVAWSRRMPFRSPAFCLGAACAAVPVVLMNQQIVTGVMLSTRDFERYSNYPPLVLAAVIVIGATGPRRWLGAGITPLTVAGIAGIGLVVILGQRETVKLFRAYNEASVGLARAIRTAAAGEAEPPRVLLEEVDLVPLVAVRLHGRAQVEFVLDYTETVLRPIPRFDADGGVEHGAGDFHRARLFEHFARSGLSVAEVERLLGQEAASIGTGSAYLLHFLFHPAEVWYPFSDSRQLRPESVRAALPAIVRDYARFLADPPEVLERPVLYVAQRGHLPPAADSMWSYRALAEGASPSAPAYVAYVQSPRSPRQRMR
jgi:hypothetical protein